MKAKVKNPSPAELEPKQESHMETSLSPALITTDNRGFVIAATPEAARLFSRPPDRIVGSHIAGFLTPAGAFFFNRLYRDAFSGLPAKGRIDICRPDSGLLPVIIQHRRDDAAPPAEGFLTFQLEPADTADLDQSELSRHGGFMEAFIKAPAWLVISTFKSGRYIQASETFLEAIGYTRDEVLGRTSLELNTWENPGDREVIAQTIRETGHILNHEVKRRAKSGRVLDTIFSGVLIDLHGEDCLISVSQDVTAIKEREEALRESQRTVRAMFELIPDMVFSFKTDGTYIFVHKPPSFEAVMPDNLTSKNMADTVDPQVYQTRMALVKEAMARGGGEVVKHEYTVEVSGQTRHREARYVPFGSDQVMAVVQDTSERKALEQRLQQSQKMEAVGTLAGGIAHDFNNILQAVNGYVELMIREGEFNRNWLPRLKAIEQALAGAGDLVSRLLTFSHRTEPKFASLALNQVVIQTMALLSRTIPKMVYIELKLADGLSPVLGDGHQLEQIILNLAANSRDAMPEGGLITIETKNLPAAGKNPGKDRVLLIFSDSGPGMDPKVLPHIFEPFYTTKGVGEGTGLGLATVYGVVERHGGSIAVESAPGQGTRFEITLPAAECAGAEVAPGAAPPEEARAPAHRTILLVDDEDNILDSTGQALASMGYEVLTARSGEEALEVVRGGRARPDLVILDLGMPGMGGQRCLENLPADNPSLPVIVASGYAQEEHRARAKAAGAVRFLRKPYRLKELAKDIADVLKD